MLSKAMGHDGNWGKFCDTDCGLTLNTIWFLVPPDNSNHNFPPDLPQTSRSLQFLPLIFELQNSRQNFLFLLVAWEIEDSTWELDVTPRQHLLPNDFLLFTVILFNSQQEWVPRKWRLSWFDEGSGVSFQTSCRQTHHSCHKQHPCQS